MSVTSFRYSVFDPEEIKFFNRDDTGCPTDSIDTVSEDTTKNIAVTCYIVNSKSPNDVLESFEYQVTNINSEHRITEIRFERGKDVPFREQLAAFHFARTWYKNHDDKHEKDDDKYDAFVAGYKIIYKSDDTAYDDKQSTPNNARPVIGVKKSTQYTVSENNVEADRCSTYTDYDALSTTSAYQQENTFLGRLTTKLKSRFSATTDHTNFHSALLTDADEMIQSGLKGYDLDKSSVAIAAGETLPLAEVKSGMNSIVAKLRKANPNKTTLFPIGVSERGTFSSGHTVLGVVTPTTTFIIDSDSLNFYGVIESIRSGFQGLRDTSNCSRYTAYTCIKLAKAIDNHLGSKRTVDEKYIRKTLSSFTRPSLETLRQLSLATIGVSVENKTDEEWDAVELPNG